SVRHGEVERHHEGIGDEEEQEQERGRDEHGPEHRLPVHPDAQPRRQPRAAALYRDLVSANGHQRRSPSLSITISVRLASGCASPNYPARIFFISPSAQAMASLVEVPVTSLAIMFGRRWVLVMSCPLPDGGAGQP